MRCAGSAFSGPEVALDAVGIQNADLDVIEVLDGRTRVRWLALHEYAPHRVEGRLVCLFPRLVQHLDDRAVQISKQ